MLTTPLWEFPDPGESGREETDAFIGLTPASTPTHRSSQQQRLPPPAPRAAPTDPPPAMAASSSDDFLSQAGRGSPCFSQPYVFPSSPNVPAFPPPCVQVAADPETSPPAADLLAIYQQHWQQVSQYWRDQSRANYDRFTERMELLLPLEDTHQVPRAQGNGTGNTAANGTA